MGKISKDSPSVTSGDPKNYPNWKSAQETNTPLQPIHTHFTADPQGKENQNLKRQKER